MNDRSRRHFTAANKLAWNASASLHGKGGEWDRLLASAALPGFSVLDGYLTQIFKNLDLTGKSAVQIGCNNARELLSLASLGIRPGMGIDQSRGFLDQAEKLARATGLQSRFIEADIYELPSGLGAYELALITIGVLNWMPDLPEFFGIVSGLLVPGGSLVIYDTHPFMETFDPSSEKPYEPAFSYFDHRPQVATQTITYDGLDHGTGETGYWFIHPLGEIVTACVQGGFGIVSLKEFGHTIREPEYDVYEGRSAQIPMSYCMVAKNHGRCAPDAEGRGA